MKLNTMKRFLVLAAVLVTLLTCLPLSTFATEIPDGIIPETQAPVLDDEHCHCETVPSSKYCPECGKLHPYYDDFWLCSGCGEIVPPSNYCAACGTQRGADAAPKTQFGINASSLKETLPIMGMGMLGIFLVIGTIVLVVIILSAISKKADGKGEKKA